VRIFFSGEDTQSIDRTALLRGGLVRRHHDVYTASALRRYPDARTDLWMYGLHHRRTHPMPPGAARALASFAGAIAFFQSDDDLDFFMEKIPRELAERARLFLRNQWRGGDTPAPEVRARRGYITPLVRPLRPRPGELLRARRRVALFYGTGTGITETGTAGARATVVRAMRASGLPFDGGLTPHRLYETPADLLVKRISQRAHQAKLEGARIALAPWGNNPITYRLFEGLAARCLVLAQSLRGVDWPAAGLEAGRHYVELRDDLGDLTEKVAHYLDRPNEAQAIADEGHAWCVGHLSFRGAGFPDDWLDEVLRTWGDVLTPAEPSLRARLRALTVALRARM